MFVEPKHSTERSLNVKSFVVNITPVAYSHGSRLISQFVVSYRGKELWVIPEVTRGQLYINCYDHG